MVETHLLDRTERLGLLNSLHDEAGLSDRLRSIVAVALESGNDALSIDVTALRHKPSRRFGQELDTDDETNGKDDLEGDGETPVERGVNVRETEIDPVRSGIAKYVSRMRLGGRGKERQLTSKREQFRWRSCKKDETSGSIREFDVWMLTHMDASIQMRRPRLCEREHSAIHEAFRRARNIPGEHVVKTHSKKKMKTHE